MTCVNCNANIIYEAHMKLVNADGDFACTDWCAKEYVRKRDEFFNNIPDDEWYRKNYPELNPQKDES